MSDERRVNGMFRKASLTSITVMYLMPWSLWRFSSKVGIMYFGRRMALLRVCEGSRHTRNFAGLFGVALLSRTTILEIQSVGCETRISWPVASCASKAVLILSSLEIG